MQCDLEKLELFGVDYIFEVVRKLTEEMNYRICVTDGIRLIAKINAVMGGGDVDMQRYYDIIRPPKNAVRNDDRTADDIVSEVVAKTGIIIVDEGGE